MATSAPETTTKCKAKMDPNDKQGELEAENAKIWELLRATSLCLGPLTKVCLKAVDALRKSQVRFYLQKAKGPNIKPLTPEQTKVIDDCHKICLDYQKMKVDSETFFAYLCSGIYMNKKQRKKEKAKLRRRNKKSPQQLPVPAEDQESTFLEWKETTERMFEIYEKLTAMYKSLVEIIQAVDPSKKTGLAQIFKSPELDGILDEIARLKQTLSSSDLAALCCGCGGLQSLVAKLTLTGIKRKKNCICSGCGLDMLQVEAAQAAQAAAITAGRTVPSTSTNDNQKKQDEKMVECKFVVGMSQEEEQEKSATASSSSSDKLINKEENKVVDEWDYSVDYHAMDVSMADTILQKFFFSRMKQNPNPTIFPEFTVDLANFRIKLIKNVKVKDENKSDLEAIKQDQDQTSDLIDRQVSQIFQKKEISEELIEGGESSSTTTTTTTTTLDNEYDEDEGLETYWVEVEDKETQTDFVNSDSEVEILDESVVKLCIQDPKGVVKAKKVPVRK